jgi:hypothetical protein
MITPDNLTNREWDVLALVAEGKKIAKLPDGYVLQRIRLNSI